jgi:hypothetical protein
MIMKPALMNRRAAFTQNELIVVVAIVVFSFWVSLVLNVPRGGKLRAMRIACVNNLKEIGTAYRIWAGDNGDLPPPQQKVAKGGWADFLTNADQGAICWTNYFIMQNELALAPKLLICPVDDRNAALDFSNQFNNTHVSYFIGVSASDALPQSILGGDRNLGPGKKPDPDYGFSPKSGKGNDVAIPITGSISWSLKMHSNSNTAGAGNILLGDGSVQQVSSAAFTKTWLPSAPPTTNWPAGHAPATPSIRLVFP